MSKVTLISYTQNPERLISSAAKLCYSPSSINDIQDSLTNEEAAKFVDMLSTLGHESPIEHVSFTFGIEGISRACLAQITRHRIASFSVQSQRYVNENMFEYVIPPEINSIDQAKEEYESFMVESQRCYSNLTNILKSKHKENLLKSGMNEKTAEKTAEKMAIEDARFVLPNACETKMICTFNARSLMNFFRHRCCNRAQWEIRDIAIQMLKLVLEVAPSLFKNAGPSCVKSSCSEGKMSCGKSKDVREFFENLKNNN